MGSTFYSLRYHVVFSTKERRPLVRAEWRAQLHQYMGGTLRGLGVVPEAMGGVQDHVHLLMSGRTTDAPADLIRELKKASSVWVAENYDPLFASQEGYAIFSVSCTHAMALRNYIARQEQHHGRLPFVDELGRLLGKNGVNYEPKYLE
jgi:REP element-mobilizing transposase RayT